MAIKIHLKDGSVVESMHGLNVQALEKGWKPGDTTYGDTAYNRALKRVGQPYGYISGNKSKDDDNKENTSGQKEDKSFENKATKDFKIPKGENISNHTGMGDKPIKMEKTPYDGNKLTIRGRGANWNAVVLGKVVDSNSATGSDYLIHRFRTLDSDKKEKVEVYETLTLGEIKKHTPKSKSSPKESKGGTFDKEGLSGPYTFESTIVGSKDWKVFRSELKEIFESSPSKVKFATFENKVRGTLSGLNKEKALKSLQKDYPNQAKAIESALLKVQKQKFESQKKGERFIGDKEGDQFPSMKMLSEAAKNMSFNEWLKNPTYINDFIKKHNEKSSKESKKAAQYREMDPDDLIGRIMDAPNTWDKLKEDYEAEDDRELVGMLKEQMSQDELVQIAMEADEGMDDAPSEGSENPHDKQDKNNKLKEKVNPQLAKESVEDLLSMVHSNSTKTINSIFEKFGVKRGENFNQSLKELANVVEKEASKEEVIEMVWESIKSDN